MKGLLKSLHRGRSRSPSKASHTQGIHVVDSVQETPPLESVSGKEQKKGRFPSRRRQEQSNDAEKENNQGNTRFPSRLREVLAGVKERGRFPSPQRSANDINPSSKSRRPSPLRRMRSARKNESTTRGESPSRRPFRFLHRHGPEVDSTKNRQSFHKESPTSATTEPINSPLSLVPNDSDDDEVFFEQQNDDESTFEDIAEASEFLDCTDVKVKEEITALRQGLRETSDEDTSLEMELTGIRPIHDDDDDEDEFQDCLQVLPEEESFREDATNTIHIVTPDSKQTIQSDSPSSETGNDKGKRGHSPVRLDSPSSETGNDKGKRGHSPVRPGSPSRTLNSVTQIVVMDSFKYNKLLPTDLSSVALDRVFNEITTWTEMIHKGKMVPRLVTMQGDIDDNDTEPVFRGNFSYQPALHSWTPMVKTLRDLLSEKLDQPLNHAVICCFRNGEDYLSEMSSNTLDTATGSPIVKLSLGAPRTMILRPKRMCNGERVPSPRPTTKVELAHGSVLRIGPETNRKMTHEIKRHSHYSPNVGQGPESTLIDDEEELASSLLTKNANLRICITFRHVVTFRDGETGQVFGKGALSKTNSGMKASVVEEEFRSQRNDMMDAFQCEIRNSDFDQAARFGKGFDAIPFQTISSSFFTLPLLEDPDEAFFDAVCEETQLFRNGSRSITAKRGRRSRGHHRVKGSRSFSQQRKLVKKPELRQSNSFNQHNRISGPLDTEALGPLSNNKVDPLPEPKWRKKPEWNVGNNSNRTFEDGERQFASSYRTPSRRAPLRRTKSEPSILPGHVKRTSEWFENLFRHDDEMEGHLSDHFISRSWRKRCDGFDSPAGITKTGVKMLRRSNSAPCLGGVDQTIPSLNKEDTTLSSPAIPLDSSDWLESPVSNSCSESLDKASSSIFRTTQTTHDVDHNADGDNKTTPRASKTSFSDCEPKADVEDEYVLETPVEIYPTREKYSGIALLAVDLVNDFLSEDPSFYFGKLGSPIAPRRKDLLERIRCLANDTRRMGGVCFFIRSRYGAWSAPQTGGRLKSRPAGAHMEKVEYCNAGSAGADFHPEMENIIVNSDVQFTKEWYSAFMGTILDKQLQRLKVGTVVVCGATTNHSVSATVKSARNLGYNVILSSDGTAQLDHRLQARSERRLRPFVQTILQKGQALDSVVSPEPCVGRQEADKLDEPLHWDCYNRSSGFGAGDSIIIPNFLDATAADALLESLAPQRSTCAEWQEVEGDGRILAATKHLVEPNAHGHIPVYRGHGPKPWDRDFTSSSFDEIENLRSAVQSQTGHSVNFGQLGSGYQDFYSEQNLDLSQGSMVAAVALGGDRVLELKPKKSSSSLAPQSITLKHNSLVLLGPETTRLFLHATPAVEGASEPHIQVTFMDVATFYAKDVSRGIPALYGAGAQFSSHSDLQQAEAMQRGFEQTGMAIAGAYALSVLRPGRGGSLMVTVMGAAIASATAAMWFRREREKLWNEEQKRLDELLSLSLTEPISQEEARRKIYRGSN